MVATRALVTGAGGFIGSHLVEMLVREGYIVRAMTRYTSGSHKGNLALLAPEIRDEIEIHPADLHHSDSVHMALSGIDVVFHLGALISIPYSYQRPEETVGVNIQGTLNVLQAMRQHGTQRGVIVSTSEVYGSAKYVPIDEKHPLQPQSPYSASKIGAEALSISFHRSYATPVVVVRPFNTYGPRQSARAVIPTIISQALTKDTLSLGAIHTIRDYTYATDTARGLMLAAQRDEACGQVINLGTGQSVSIADLAAMILKLIGRSIPISANDNQRLRPEASEVLRLESDNRLAKMLLGWQPQVSLEEGLLGTIEWIRSHMDQFDPDIYSI